MTAKPETLYERCPDCGTYYLRAEGHTCSGLDASAMREMAAGPAGLADAGPAIASLDMLADHVANTATLIGSYVDRLGLDDSEALRPAVNALEQATEMLRAQLAALGRGGR